MSDVDFNLVLSEKKTYSCKKIQRQRKVTLLKLPGQASCLCISLSVYTAFSPTDAFSFARNLANAMRFERW